MEQATIQRAADLIRGAETIVVTAGAGMGVDSGLPDFRGDQGFWKAYPMYQRLGLTFMDAANPAHFRADPPFGWGFYGHRTNLYRETVPHEGFALLRRWIERYGLHHFVVTSNVDGQFQKAGFADEKVLEVHGSIHHLQCLSPCSDRIWSNREEFPIDLETMRSGHVPTCPACGGTARPNILMFNDFSWIHDRTSTQEERYADFLQGVRGTRLLVVEMGAGTAIPTIRFQSERLGSLPNASVIRINPREPQIRPPHLSLATGSCAALEAIEELLIA